MYEWRRQIPSKVKGNECSGLWKHTAGGRTQFFICDGAQSFLDGNYARDGLGMLATIYRNRRQYNRAANVLREAIRMFPDVKEYQTQLSQITRRWVELLNCKTFPAGVKPEINLKFRNTKRIFCKLTKINISAFLRDIKKYLKDPKKRKAMTKLGYQPQQIGNWLINKQGNLSRALYIRGRTC